MLLFYVLSIFVVAFLLMQFPSVTLALFVLFSAYHFGEQHWEPYLSNAGYVSKIFMMSYGMVVFFLLFNAHSILVTEIIADISGYWFSASVLKALLYVFIMITLLIYTIRYYSKFDGSFKVRQLFYLLVFFVVFNSTTLLWAFAIYFIFWHSLPSLLDQMNFLYGRRDYKGFVMFVKSSWLYWTMAVLSLGIYFLIIQHYYTLELSLFFAFLTALTIPHIFLMYFSKKVE